MTPRDTSQSDSELKTQITQFVADFAALPNPTETLWSCPDPAGKPGIYVVLRFHRSQDQWMISWDYDDEFKDPRDTDWRPLVDAPTAIKLAAIAMFPGIWERRGT